MTWCPSDPQIASDGRTGPPRGYFVVSPEDIFTIIIVTAIVVVCAAILRGVWGKDEDTP